MAQLNLIPIDVTKVTANVSLTFTYFKRSSTLGREEEYKKLQ
jgi:hypothetical protein